MKPERGYEVHGMDKIPEGPGLLVVYHGAFPVDYFYFVCRLYLQTGRLCHSVVDYHFSKIPGISLFYNVHGLTHDGRMECVDILKKGHLLGVLPGGVREALFSDENYSLLWGRRSGFAHVARDAKVVSDHMPCMKLEPASSAYIARNNKLLIYFWGENHLNHFLLKQNMYNSYHCKLCIGPLKWLYERTRWLIVPIYGGFPVKLCTYIGDPILYDPNITVEELAEKTKSAITNLRDKHQQIPGSIQRALRERFDK
ncbi:hypothetical protein lerEdw1_008963 [Lerista edwardsae]|nr:hypothetical protein lerEdw1_008963 [Lerista edwardsae]